MNRPQMIAEIKDFWKDESEEKLSMLISEQYVQAFGKSKMPNDLKDQDACLVMERVDLALLEELAESQWR